MHKLWSIVNKNLIALFGPFGFHSFHLDRSSIPDMTWRNQGILHIATMMHRLVHVDVTESLEMLLWDQL